MRRLYLIGVLLTLLATSPLATAAEPRASLPDIEDEVMCPTCGTPLNHAFSPQAERQRDFIRSEIARGRDKEQIKQALVAEFGREVLATPDDSGFDLAAYLVPAAVVGFALAAIVFGLIRWRRTPPEADETAGPGLSPADSSRLERELSRYDP
jgi:cytochrome c-type biogenesis protein CcmH